MVCSFKRFARPGLHYILTVEMEVESCTPDTKQAACRRRGQRASSIREPEDRCYRTWRTTYNPADGIYTSISFDVFSDGPRITL